MKSAFRIALFLMTVAVLVSGPARTSAGAETTEFRIARQPGLVYLQPVIMEQRKLVEKHAAALGLPDVKIEWRIITSGGVMTEALISSTIDVAITGVSNMLLAWDRTNRNVKMVAGVAGLPFELVTRNPQVKSIKDFGPNDRIAVPTVRVSMQSMMLGMALEQAYGPGAHNRLDANQVQMGHPEATQAVLNPTHEVNSHYSIPPFLQIVLKAPNVHSVLKSMDTLGGAASVTNAWATQRFVEANPLKAKALVAAIDEASKMIADDPKTAAEIYLSVTKERVTVDELAAIVKGPGAVFSATPSRSMLYAEYMHRIGLTKNKPASWKEYAFPLIHDLPGS